MTNERKHMNLFHHPKKTVASVMAVFQKTIDELDAVRQENLTEAGRQRQIADDASAAAAAARLEADKAAAVAVKLKAIID